MSISRNSDSDKAPVARILARVCLAVVQLVLHRTGADADWLTGARHHASQADVEGETLEIIVAVNAANFVGLDVNAVDVAVVRLQQFVQLQLWRNDHISMGDEGRNDSDYIHLQFHIPHNAAQLHHR